MYILYATFADAVGAGPIGVARCLGAGAGGASRAPADLAAGRPQEGLEGAEEGLDLAGGQEEVPAAEARPEGREARPEGREAPALAAAVGALGMP